ncbi:hypothetical protein BD311DRAFT_756325 [Dichomitus squalens]|uniref:Uncharacterized protein n=1 Tax=Dichomitus squalens TaxID=114155 RepID=A0A4Q9MPB7_9APHY|nr:hypothetical protein BD311DRAFT_756325 [Dichomitus squalens]
MRKKSIRSQSSAKHSRLPSYSSSYTHLASFPDRFSLAGCSSSGPIFTAISSITFTQGLGSIHRDPLTRGASIGCKSTFSAPSCMECGRTRLGETPRSVLFRLLSITSFPLHAPSPGPGPSKGRNSERGTRPAKLGAAPGSWRPRTMAILQASARALP